MPDGPTDAALLCVGRDYGFHEHRAGRPFVGPAGFYLNRALLEAGLPRSLVRVTNVVNQRPRADEWHAHEPGAVNAGMRALHDELQRFSAFGGRLVLALGEQALQACTRGDPFFKPERKATITETRGYLFPGIHGLPVLAAGHPAAFLHGGWIPGYPLFGFDVKKAARFLAGKRPDASRQEVFVRDIVTLHEHVEKALAVRRVAVDIEEDRCLAFAYTPELGVAVPAYTEEPFKSAVQELLLGAQGLVFQNGQYDTWRLAEYGFQVGNWTDDIMLAWFAKEPLIAGKSGGAGRTEKSLRFLASLLTWEPFWKDYAFQTAEEEWTLNAKDARVTLEICEALVP